MTRAPDQLAPSWLPRQQRRYVDRQLRKLMRPGTCSVCGSPFKHNTRTAGGLDSQGNVVLAGECCTDQVVATFTKGFYSHRDYDFLQTRGEPSTNTKLTGEQITDALAAYQKAITVTDKVFGDDFERRGGVAPPLKPKLCVLDTAWKDDDSSWFKQNPERAHRVRLSLPGECDEEVAKTPAGQVMVMLIRQVEPGKRIRAAVSIGGNLLPVPDDEATTHALFEMAMRQEPVPTGRQALIALIEKYSTGSSQ